MTPTASPPIAGAASRIAALRTQLAALAGNQAWRDGWKHRAGNPDAWRSAVRVGGYILDDANPNATADELDGLERWLHRVVSGELYDSIRPAKIQETNNAM